MKKGFLISKHVEDGDIEHDLMKVPVSTPMFMTRKSEWAKNIADALWFDSIDDAYEFIIGDKHATERRWLGVEQNRLQIVEVSYEMHRVAIDEEVRLRILKKDGLAKLSKDQRRALGVEVEKSSVIA